MTSAFIYDERLLFEKLWREGGCTKADGLRQKARLRAGQDFNTLELMAGITHGMLTTSDTTHTALHAWGGYPIQIAGEIQYLSSSNVASVQLREGRTQG